MSGWGLAEGSPQLSVLRQLNFQRPSRGFCSERSSRFAGCALAFGRVELFIRKSLTARMNPCPDKHALGLHSKGSAAKTRLLRPRESSRDPALTFAHPVLMTTVSPPATDFQRLSRALSKLSPAAWNASRSW